MTRFECPRCQHVFTAETAADQAFADCPQCSSLALPTGSSTDASAQAMERALGSPTTDDGLTQEQPVITSADDFRPPPSAQAPGIFNNLLDDESVAPSFEQKPTAVHSSAGLPASLFQAPPSLEGAPVYEPSPFVSQEGAPVEEEQDLYRAATEAFTPQSQELPPGASASFGLDAPWAGLPTPSSDGPAADQLPVLTPMGLDVPETPPAEIATEVNERTAGLQDLDLLEPVAVGGAESSEESVFSSDISVRPSLTVEDAAALPSSSPTPALVPAEVSGPSSIIIEEDALAPPQAPVPLAPEALQPVPLAPVPLAPDLLTISPNEPAEDFGAEPPGSFSLDDEDDDAARLRDIESSQEGAALDDRGAAALFADASFDDLEAAFDEAADRPDDAGRSRAEHALREASSQDLIFERPPEIDDDGLGVPSAPGAPRAPQLTLKKPAHVPHLSLSQATIEAAALPLTGGSFVTDASGPNAAAAADIPTGRRGFNSALDEETLVTREPVSRPNVVPELRVEVPTLMSGLTPLRVLALIFVAGFIGTVVGAVLTPGKPDRPITQRVRAEQQFAEGNKAYADGKLDDALGYYRGAVARDPNYGLGHRALGAVLAKQKRYEDAARAYRTYLELTPGAVDDAQVRDILKRYDAKSLPAPKSSDVVKEDNK